jgi:hypothetical protein
MSRFAAFDVTPRRPAGCLCRCPGHDDRVDIGVLPGAVDAGPGGRWQSERRPAGGRHEGAYLLIRGGGSRAVLKWRAGDPERLPGARERVEAARARGWPAPEWPATGQAPAGEARVSHRRPVSPRRRRWPVRAGRATGPRLARAAAGPRRR